jgi:hypothetical protein
LGGAGLRQVLGSAVQGRAMGRSRARLWQGRLGQGELGQDRARAGQG